MTSASSLFRSGKGESPPDAGVAVTAARPTIMSSRESSESPYGIRSLDQEAFPCRTRLPQPDQHLVRVVRITACAHSDGPIECHDNCSPRLERIGHEVDGVGRGVRDGPRNSGLLSERRYSCAPRTLTSFGSTSITRPDASTRRRSSAHSLSGAWRPPPPALDPLPPDS